MSNVVIEYRDNIIAEMNDSGTKTLNTGGFYCDDNIVVKYTAKEIAGVDDSFRRWNVTVTGEISSNRVYFLQDDWLREHRTNDNLVVAIIPKFTISFDGATPQSGIFLGTNVVWASSLGNSYKTISAFINKTGGAAPRARTFGLTDSSDIGDVGITVDGRLNVIATANNPLAPGEYCVVAWLM